MLRKKCQTCNVPTDKKNVVKYIFFQPRIRTCGNNHGEPAAVVTNNYHCTSKPPHKKFTSILIEEAVLDDMMI
jgi:hypothetical protein